MVLPNPNQLDPTDAAEVALFADSLSLSSEAVLDIVAKVGPMRPAIRFYAARGSTETKRGPARPALPKAAPKTAVDVPQPHSIFGALRPAATRGR